MLFPSRPIEPISEQIPDQVPLGKPQRFDGEAYESPALPLSCSAAVVKLIERDRERQPTSLERIAIEKHMTAEARPDTDNTRAS